MDRIGNLFELAEKQLINEINNGTRTRYSLAELVDYAIRIRKFLDRRGGNIPGILNQVLNTPQEQRRAKYERTGK